MNQVEQMTTIGIVMIGTMITRFLPFLIFPPSKKTPRIISKLGEKLPSAILGMLVIYSLKDMEFSSSANHFHHYVAIMLTVCLHIWKKNMLLSIFGGTGIYVILVNTF